MPTKTIANLVYSDHDPVPTDMVSNKQPGNPLAISATGFVGACCFCILFLYGADLLYNLLKASFRKVKYVCTYVTPYIIILFLLNLSI